MTAQIQLDKRTYALPAPARKRVQRRPRPTKYPWSKMQVGDSFLVPCKSDKEKTRVANALGVNIQRRQKQYPVRYAKRKVATGVRVWRIA